MEVLDGFDEMALPEDEVQALGVIDPLPPAVPPSHTFTDRLPARRVWPVGFGPSGLARRVWPVGVGQSVLASRCWSVGLVEADDSQRQPALAPRVQLNWSRVWALPVGAAPPPVAPAPQPWPWPGRPGRRPLVPFTTTVVPSAKRRRATRGTGAVSMARGGTFVARGGAICGKARARECSSLSTAANMASTSAASSVPCPRAGPGRWAGPGRSAGPATSGLRRPAPGVRYSTARLLFWPMWSAEWRWSRLSVPALCPWRPGRRRQSTGRAN